MSLLEVLKPPGNRWLESLAESDTPLPEGVRVVRYEDGEGEVFESGTSPHRTEHDRKRESGQHSRARP